MKNKVAFLYWTDNDVNRRCGSVARSANVSAAGAIGALFGNDSNRFSAGITGDATIPVMITSADARDDIQAALDASKLVTVTLTGALRLAVKNVLTGADDPTDAIVGFSSRGITQAGNVKPDVSAPGNSIVSVGMGTGASGAVESGTSMAAPHVAGEAALVIAAHPDWRPEQVKAAIMNTANHHVYPGPEPHRRRPGRAACRRGSDRRGVRGRHRLAGVRRQRPRVSSASPSGTSTSPLPR